MIKNMLNILIAILCVVIGLPAEAARNDNYPTPLFCYVLSNGRVTTYVENSTARTSGYIDGRTDQVQLYHIYPGDNWVSGCYPTSKGKKWAWFRVSDVIYDYNYQMKKTKALKAASAYRKKEGGQKIGTVYANDVIYVVSEYGNLAQIIYPINGGYKLGWVDKSAVDWGSRPAPQVDNNYPKGNVVNVSNGLYKIASAANLNLVLDLDAGKNADGSNLHLWQWVGTPQQKFKIENCGGGYYSLTPSYTDKKIDGLGCQPNNGTNVGLWSSNGSNAQRWRFIDAGNGYVYIESKMKPGLSLDCQDRRVQNGANIQLWMRGNVAWNKWKLIKLSEPIPPQPQLSQRQQNMVNEAEKMLGSTKYDGLCQAFVKDVGVKIGLPPKSAGDALGACSKWKKSNNMDNIPVGAAVYLRSRTQGSAGNIHGHVGIYVGNGYVVHALSTVKKDTLSDLLRKYDYLGWGWQADIDLR